MKKILIIILTMFCMLPSAEAQNVVGKWKCSQEFLHSLGTRFIQMRGRYHFKKDSTFTIKIKGWGEGAALKRKNRGWSSYIRKSNGTIELTKRPEYFASKPSLQIRIKGTYSVSNGTITTKVVPNGIYCYIESGSDIPVAPSLNNDAAMLRYIMGNRMHENFSSLARTQEETIKRDYMRVWNWDHEPLEVTKKTMKVGDKVKFKKKKSLL